MFAEAWKNYKNILCVRPDNMGDVLMSQPAMRALKESVPGRKINLLTSTAGACIALFIPEVDETIPFDVPWVKTSETNGAQRLLALAGELQALQLDAAVIFTVYSQNPLPAGMLCYLAGIKTVLGYCRENPYQLINQWVPDREPLDYVVHEVERQLRLVDMAGAETSDTRLLLKIPEGTRKEATDRIWDMLNAAGIRTGMRWLVLHAGVSEEKRLYPASDYVTACQSLIRQGYKILLTGSGSERDYVDQIARQLGNAAINVAGELSIAELILLIEAAPVLISNNTGPVHIAAAVGTPVVVLYAMTNPQHTPWQVPSKVLYFEVPPELRTKNRLLQSFPGPSTPRASPEAIVAAVGELVSPRRKLRVVIPGLTTERLIKSSLSLEARQNEFVIPGLAGNPDRINNGIQSIPLPACITPHNEYDICSPDGYGEDT